MAEEMKGETLNNLYPAVFFQYTTAISVRVTLGILTPDALATIPEFYSQYSERMLEMVFKVLTEFPGSIL